MFILLLDNSLEPHTLYHFWVTFLIIVLTLKLSIIFFPSYLQINEELIM